MTDPREVCVRRPDLCGETQTLAREETARGTGTVDMAEYLRRMLGGDGSRLQTPAAPREPLVGFEADAPEPGAVASTPPPPPVEPGWVLPIRQRAFFISVYWMPVNEPYARLGDVVVIKSPQELYLLRRVKKADRWTEPDYRYYIAGYVEKQLCAYGFVLRGSIEHIAQLFRSGGYALVLGCDRRAVVRPPKREELYSIWRYEGYVVNASPARLAVIRIDDSKKARFAVDYFGKGCPIFSHYANQLLQLIGVPIQLTC
ncbi:hypothetical protein [Pyrobaculum ferrireducens]|uniref:Uncharacterized protein n=1 Tax=Pyrobaculum ferrireducens TaxID=1104324 RepID=G7VG87_9CREN|nr:hypothetical protein [Pyrobaculum ferrireducens]AET34286.1 hypothetical protein P186_2910 [Pyrobaculum ferrireducens]